jgi:hypothetical protein
MRSVNPLAETAKEGKQLPIAFGEVIHRVGTAAAPEEF